MRLNLNKGTNIPNNFSNFLVTMFALIMNFLIWGLTASAIYFLDWSPLTVIVAMIMTVNIRNSNDLEDE